MKCLVKISSFCYVLRIKTHLDNKVKMNRVLHLVLKHQWFDKIVSGEKISEYRECSDYWNKRFENKHYDTVVFHKGYTNTTAVYKIISIGITTAPNDLNLPKCWEIKLKN